MFPPTRIKTKQRFGFGDVLRSKFVCFEVPIFGVKNDVYFWPLPKVCMGPLECPKSLTIIRDKFWMVLELPFGDIKCVFNIHIPNKTRISNQSHYLSLFVLNSNIHPKYIQNPPQKWVTKIQNFHSIKRIQTILSSYGITSE